MVLDSSNSTEMDVSTVIYPCTMPRITLKSADSVGSAYLWAARPLGRVVGSDLVTLGLLRLSVCRKCSDKELL